MAGHARGCLRRLEAGRIDTDEFIEAAEDISAQAGRASDMLRHISGFISDERPEPTTVDVNHVVKSALAIGDVELSKSDISIVTDLENDLPSVAGASSVTVMPSSAIRAAAARTDGCSSTDVTRCPRYRLCCARAPPG